jgi:O-antigen ligase
VRPHVDLPRPDNSQFQRDTDSSIRRAGFYLALAFIFFRFSLLHEVFALVLGFDTHLITILGVPVLALTLLSGGIRRTFRGRPTYYWLGFALWLLLATPFSSWIGGSVGTVTSYLRVDFPLLFIIGGLTLTWLECKQMIFAVALAALTNVTTARFFQKAGEARLTLETGSIANANDFVAHILLVMPFVLFVLLTPGRSWLTRSTCVGTIAYGLYFASTAASRGGLVAFAVMCCFILVRATPKQRIGALAGVAVLVAVILPVLPSNTKQRYATLFTGDAGDSEAVDSARARQYLLQTSIAYTLQHPLFGVGPGEFMDVEGSTAVKNGHLGAWHVPHNSYTQVSSECGIPALILFLATSVSAYLTLRKTFLATRGVPRYRPIANAAFCVQLSLIGFSCAILFLSLVYTLYLPALSGFAIAIQNVARRELSVPGLAGTGSGLAA